MFGTAFSFDRDTGESTGPVDAQYSPLDPETMLRPANSLVKPPPPVGALQVAVFLLNYQGERNDAITEESDWTVYPDWRGVALYKTATGTKFFLEKQDINVLPADVDATPLAPGIDDTWDGSSWVLDTAKQRARLVATATAKRDDLLAAAAAAIAPLQDAVDLGNPTAEEQALLTAWKQHRVALNRIQLQAGYPSDITWPVAPGASA
ncbi:tail fiber assembly protein [uncultured Herbaspirillum sp.]|uniref:tail fiber assembly protein n=1 Tax=uncultured Herbaspirillum sp. TaxID=160236 RepID=UPI00261D173D|nr:tail fiber assembly protein [uncultured Herbaspirillum sp.]